jgi:hypothetical protein
MPDVIVIRGMGNSPGPDIVDPLLTTVDACLARGRNELDEQASDLQDVEITIPFRANLRLGQVAQVSSLSSGELWYGKISGIKYTYDLADLYATISIRKPLI